MTHPTDAEREAFENRYSSLDLEHAGNSYKSPRTDFIWKGWQARFQHITPAQEIAVLEKYRERIADRLQNFINCCDLHEDDKAAGIASAMELFKEETDALITELRKEPK